MKRLVKQLTGFIMAILIVLSFLLPVSCSLADTSEADQQAEQIFINLARIYNNALGFLEKLEEVPFNTDPAEVDSSWFFKMFIDKGDDGFKTYTWYSNYISEIRPDADMSKYNVIYETLFEPLYDKYGHTSAGITSACITLNEIMWRDEKGQERLDEQKKALRQFRTDYPDYDLLKELQNLYKAVLDITSYAYEGYSDSTLTELKKRVSDYKATRLEMRGEFDLFFDWDDSIFGGSQDAWKEFFINYWNTTGAEKEAKKKAELEASKTRAAHTFDHVGSFHEGLCKVEKGQKYGYINTKGELVVPLIYDYVDDFQEGFGLVFKGDFYISPGADKSNGKCGFVDVTGKEVIPLKWNEAKSFTQGYAIIANRTNDGEREFGIINTNGEETLQIGVAKDVYYTEVGLYKVWKQDPTSFHLVDAVGNKVGKEYSWMDKFHDGLVKVKLDTKCGFINAEGQETIALEYDDLRDYSEGLAAFKKNGKWGFMDEEYKVVIKPAFDDAREFRNGLAAVEKGEKWGFIDKTGKMVIKPAYSVVYSFSDEGYAACKVKDNHWVYINKEGKTAFDDGWSMLTGGFRDGLAEVKIERGKTSLSGVINTEGKLIVDYIEADFVLNVENGFIMVQPKNGAKAYVCDLEGNVLYTGGDSIRYSEGFFTVLDGDYLTILDKDFNIIF